jgi:heptosyltransferase II
LKDGKFLNITFQQQLSILLGKKWINEEYILSSDGLDIATFNFGFNWKAGSKWPGKQLPQEFWESLELELGNKFTTSWQQGFENLSEYINWIQSCETLITLDSLGLHIALSLGKNVIAIFGPTNDKNVKMYERGRKICYHGDQDKLIKDLLRIVNEA